MVNIFWSIQASHKHKFYMPKQGVIQINYLLVRTTSIAHSYQYK